LPPESAPLHLAALLVAGSFRCRRNLYVPLSPSLSQAQTETRLSQLDTSVAGESDKRFVLLSTLNHFADIFKAKINGALPVALSGSLWSFSLNLTSSCWQRLAGSPAYQSMTPEPVTLSTGARIRHIFYNTFCPALEVPEHFWQRHMLWQRRTLALVALHRRRP
jgi:hypothetical protein